MFLSVNNVFQCQVSFLIVRQVFPDFLLVTFRDKCFALIFQSLFERFHSVFIKFILEKLFVVFQSYFKKFLNNYKIPFSLYDLVGYLKMFSCKLLLQFETIHLTGKFPHNDNDKVIQFSNFSKLFSFLISTFYNFCYIFTLHYYSAIS